MARNKYPDVTIARILDTAMQLFLQKGYEHTTIQDIVDALGNLSKGAIYHHFKSKEDIMEAVIFRMDDLHCQPYNDVMEDQSLNGLQKLKKLFTTSLNHPEQEATIKAAPNLLRNPKFFVAQFHMTLKEIAPKYVEQVIRQGVADGSIQTEYPKEMAEVIMLLANIWISPWVSDMSKEDMTNKLLFLKQLTDVMGVPVLDESMLERLEDLRALFESTSK